MINNIYFKKMHRDDWVRKKSRISLTDDHFGSPSNSKKNKVFPKFREDTYQETIREQISF